MRRHTRRRKGCSPNAVPSRGAPNAPGEFSSGSCPSSPILSQVAECRAARRVTKPGGISGPQRDRGARRPEGIPPRQALTLRAFSSRAEERGAPVAESAAERGAGLGARLSPRGRARGSALPTKCLSGAGGRRAAGTASERNGAELPLPARPAPATIPAPARGRGGPLRSSAVGQLRSPVAACRSSAGCRGTESSPLEPACGRRLVSSHPKRSSKSPQSLIQNLPRFRSKEVDVSTLPEERVGYESNTVVLARDPG